MMALVRLQKCWETSNQTLLKVEDKIAPYTLLYYIDIHRPWV